MNGEAATKRSTAMAANITVDKTENNRCFKNNLKIFIGFILLENKIYVV
ncbi:unnamed protein product [Cuscuta europaea]|uniref:Uncharacterized protein n=1 Tax=Cuscuta europaea TaxID=41803 RepID=A0A9P0ZBL3_CUSEU|nr:unnamed protein product [Cuscuta europaea]